ncbi:MAG: copper chaperone PCu(A)C [Alphaproteobacteria bacterium]|nr:copper chaperone PCu(A)C [Alphaproteobacteria bacterium]
MIVRALFFLVLALAAAIGPSALAQQFKSGPMLVEHPYARVSAARNGAAYVTLVNTGNQPDRLIRVASPRADKVEMHTMTMDGDIMRMRQVTAIDVPVQGKVEMRPGEGLHIMLVGLKGALTAGERFPLSLEFEHSGKIDVTVAVEKPAPPKKP